MTNLVDFWEQSTDNRGRMILGDDVMIKRMILRSNVFNEGSQREIKV